MKKNIKKTKPLKSRKNFPTGFTKMHGLGNDFIVIDGRFLHNTDYKKFAAKYCSRFFGIGADGLIVLKKSEKADYKMLFYNPDGSAAQICGNGLRCLAKYIYDKRLRENKHANYYPLPGPPLSRGLRLKHPQVGRGTKGNFITIETSAGIKTAKLFAKGGRVTDIEISLGKPVFNPKLIPINLKEIKDNDLKIKDQTFKIHCVSMGNPHCVIFDGNFEKAAMAAQEISNHKIFPEKINVEFVKIINKNHIKVFVWERGAGPTLACGTGAAAAAVIAALVKGLNRKLKVTLPGGSLFVRWGEKDNEVYLKGPAETVFEGNFPEERK